MAGNIQNLNLKQLESKINEYSAEVKNIQENLKNVYQSFITMKQYWTGKQMNNVIGQYNNECDEFYIHLSFFGGTVQSVLKEIYEQYVSMENAGVAQNISYNLVIDDLIKKTIPYTSSEVVKFEQQKVKNLVSTINGYLNNVETGAKKIINILDDIAPYSDSLKKLVTNYKSEGEAVKMHIVGLKTALKSQMERCVNLVINTESYNESDASRIKSGNNNA